jgi:hypothetical protein
MSNSFVALGDIVTNQSMSQEVSRLYREKLRTLKAPRKHIVNVQAYRHDIGVHMRHQCGQRLVLSIGLQAGYPALTDLINLMVRR